MLTSILRYSRNNDKLDVCKHRKIFCHLICSLWNQKRECIRDYLMINFGCSRFLGKKIYCDLYHWSSYLGVPVACFEEKIWELISPDTVELQEYILPSIHLVGRGWNCPQGAPRYILKLSKKTTTHFVIKYLPFLFSR